MFKGFVFGSLMGAIVSAVVLAATSLVSDQPAGNAPPRAPATEGPEAVAEAGGGGGLDLAPAGPDAAPAALDRGLGEPAPPVSGEGAPPSLMPGTVTEPAALPEAGIVADAPAAPDQSAAPELATGTDAPVEPLSPGAAPAQPMSEADLVLSTEPAQPRPPAVEETVLEAAPEPGSQDVAALEEMLDGLAEAAPEVDAEPPEAPQADLEETQDAMPAPEATETPEVAALDTGATEPVEPPATTGQDGGEAPDPAPEPEAPEPPEPAVVEEPAGEADAAPQEPETDPAPEPPAEEAVEPEPPAAPTEDPPEVPDAAPEAPQSSLPGGDTGVVIRRPSDTPAPEAGDTETDAPEIDPDAPPLRRFAAAFEAPDLPLMTVVLLDDGSLPGAVEAVAALGVPVTVALDPARADAAEVMAAYRAMGIEIAAAPDLPSGARASDVEIALEAGFGSLDAAVALVDATGSWQGPGGVAQQTVDRLAAEGRGFLALSSGLGTGLRIARGQDVPAAEIFSDLDDRDQDARVIRRFLDQAAFRARQQGSVVVLGRVRPDTLSALSLWSTANRAGQVALAPLSSVLLAD